VSALEVKDESLESNTSKMHTKPSIEIHGETIEDIRPETVE
jgi:hypothetical protein